MTEWLYRNPTEIRFGIDAVDSLAELRPEGRVLVVTTPGATRRGLTARISGLLSAGPVDIFDEASENPRFDHLSRTARSLDERPDAIVAVGGGSAMDSAKVLSLLLSPVGAKIRDVDTLVSSVVATGTAVPLVTVPTTAGTGAEVTPFATVWDFDTRRKLSLAGPGVHPAVALVDPALTLTLPGPETVSTGLDALSQGLEALWNANAGGVTDALAIRSVRMSLASLEMAVAEPDEIRHRIAMSESSLLAGMAISATRTALAHSISYPITLRFGVPHGLACSFTLPEVLAFVGTGAGADRMSTISTALGFDSIGTLVRRLRGVLLNLDASGRMADHGFDGAGLSELANEMISPARAGNSLRAATPADAVAIASAAWSRLSGG